MEVLSSQTDLLHVVRTLHPAGSLAGSLNRWQQQPDHHANDRNDNQQLDQSETPGATSSPNVNLHEDLSEETKNQNKAAWARRRKPTAKPSLIAKNSSFPSFFLKFLGREHCVARDRARRGNKTPQAPHRPPPISRPLARKFS
jgi:hypothetical protein